MTHEILFHRLAGNFIACFVGLIPICLSTYINDEYGIWGGPAPVIIGLTIACIWMIRLHAYQEAIRIARKKTINHTERFLLRTVIAFFIAFFIHGFGTEFQASFWVIIACAFYIGTLFWLLFDPILSHDRNLALFYVSNWYRTSRLDKFFHRDPRLWLISKIALYLLGLYLYVELWG